ncbi:MAG: translation initiation factor IF-2 [Microscillaceae bacterium]|jgi:translation initiation factor IF-2|nr:translation initiation factor IF-2 [Microscillaceae bacterium]
MSEEKMIRLSQASRELKVGIATLTEILEEKGFHVENSPNSKITLAQYEILAEEFGIPLSNLNLNFSKKFNDETTTTATVETLAPEAVKPLAEEKEPVAVINTPAETTPSAVAVEQPSIEKVEITTKLPGPKILGKIDLDSKKPVINPTEEVKKVTEEPPQAEEKAPVQTPVIEEKIIQVIPEQEPLVQTKAPSELIVETPPVEAVIEVKFEPQIEPVPEIQSMEEEKPNTQVFNEEDEVQKATPTDIIPKQSTETKTDKVIQTQVKNQAQVQSKPYNQPEKKFVKTETQAHESKESQKQEPKTITPEPKTEEESVELIKAKAETLGGLKILGKIELPSDKKGGSGKPVASSDEKERKKRKRKKKKVKKAEQVDVNAVQAKQNQGGNNAGNNNANNNNNSKGNNNTSNNSNSNHNNNNQSNRNNQNQQSQNKSGNHNNNSGNNAHRNNDRNQKKNPKKPNVEITDKQIQDQIKATLAQLSSKGKGKIKRRALRKDGSIEEIEIDESKLLKVTEFVSVSDLASIMEVSVNDLIKTCLSMGMFVSINQRLDAEAIQFIAAEYSFDVEFITAEEAQDEEEEEIDDPDTLTSRAPIVTVMGHVDHGKTSLLDYIRRTDVAAGESGGITQHIGAYDVVTDDGRRVVFLDTPGHEAFTAMRARGAKLTDVVILVVAADDSVMPQTKEAINHARVAGVPIVIAINKVDKPSANAQKIREELSQENILVESWGGKFQDQEISAKTGMGIQELLDKVLLEAEILELKANPHKTAVGTVVEASLDKGRGYVANILVQAGTLKVGDIILVGSHYGRVKAMFDHRGNRLKEAGPSTPVQVLGLDGAPQAGDTLKVMNNDREAREIAAKREQILREQNIRATKGLTLEEIGRRRALKNFSELRLIVKGDVDGSVEALSDSLLKLSTEEIEVKIIHKAVGQITEADIMLAKASEAIVLGFQVRPSLNAKRNAEQEKVQIKTYSIIYDAIEEIKDAMEGMLAPTIKEIIVGYAEVRNVFKISKIGTVAGCMVTEGYIKRNNKVRIIRDGIVTYEGDILTLKRYKDDVAEVKQNFECGIGIKNFNDLKEGDMIESFENQEVKRTL